MTPEDRLVVSSYVPDTIPQALFWAAMVGPGVIWLRDRWLKSETRQRWHDRETS